MKRLLIVGKELPPFASIEWSEWKRHNLLDYQGIIFDCRSLGNTDLSNLSIQLNSFLSSGHRIFVILPEAKLVSRTPGYKLLFVPGVEIQFEIACGRTLNRMQMPRAEYQIFFSKYGDVLQQHEYVLHTQSNPNLPWQSGITDNVDRPICGMVRNAFVLHPPQPRNEQKAYKVIIEYFKPDIDEPEQQTKPDWFPSIVSSIPGVLDCESRINTLRGKVSVLQQDISAEEQQLDERTKWADLLWLDGLALQDRVSKALAFLGIPNHSADPTGHTQDLIGDVAGHPMLFEVTGSTGSIGVEKGRQLIQWMGECDDPTNTKGILIANAYRNSPPDTRPPSPDHRIFVKELEELAVRFHFSLVDVRELFALIVQKLGGEEVAAEWVLDMLQRDGVVRVR